MDALRAPLLDVFRRGEVAHDVRVLAAQGALAPRAHEQLALLVFLTGDPDPAVAGAADATLRLIPREAIAANLARSDVGADVRSFFAARGIEPVGPAPVGEDQPLVDTSAAEGEAGTAEAAAQPVPLLQRIARLTVAQRVALAMKGSREERAVLIRDPSKLVAVAVLSSPKLSDAEVEQIAKMTSISDELLRIIANTRAWVKNYGVVVALARNPKTPVAISMNLLSRLLERDIRLLSMDRNIPDVLRISARQKLVIKR